MPGQPAWKKGTGMICGDGLIVSIVTIVRFGSTAAENPPRTGGFSWNRPPNPLRHRDHGLELREGTNTHLDCP